MKKMSKKTIITAILTLLLLFGCQECVGISHVEAKGKSATVSTKKTTVKKNSKKTVTPAYEMTAEERAYYAALCRDVFHDEITAVAIECNFIQKVNQIKTSADGMYIADFKAISGDTQNPMLIFDLYINNPDIVASHSTVEVDVYTLGVNVFENELDHYWYCDAIAYQDAQNPIIYHCLMRGAPAWLCNEEPAVVYFKQLKVGYFTLPIDIDFRLTPVRSKYLPTEYRYIGGKDVPFEGVNFKIYHIDCGLYYCDISFAFDFLGQPWANGATDFNQVSSYSDLAFEHLKANTYFLVDGNPVFNNPNFNGLAYSDDTTKKCYVHMETTGINFPYAKEVIFVCGGQVIKLK